MISCDHFFSYFPRDIGRVRAVDTIDTYDGDKKLKDHHKSSQINEVIQEIIVVEDSNHWFCVDI